MNLAPARTRCYPRGGYEEYHPYGSTAWWAGSSATVSQKRYRFTGMERDDETGLQCHGVRYYATWLGRWVSADPIGLGDGVNRFGYCHDSPTNVADGSGKWGEAFAWALQYAGVISTPEDSQAAPEPSPPGTPLGTCPVKPPSGTPDRALKQAFSQPELSLNDPMERPKQELRNAPSPTASDPLQGPLGPGGTLILSGKIGRAAAEEDASYLSFSDTDRAAAALGDDFFSVAGVAAELRARSVVQQGGDPNPLRRDAKEPSPHVDPHSLQRTHTIGGKASSKQVVGISKEMRDTGWKGFEPIEVVVDRAGTMYVVDGHHRLAGAKMAGLGKVPVAVIEDLGAAGKYFKTMREVIGDASAVGPNTLRDSRGRLLPF